TLPVPDRADTASPALLRRSARSFPARSVPTAACTPDTTAPRSRSRACRAGNSARSCTPPRFRSGIASRSPRCRPLPDRVRGGRWKSRRTCCLNALAERHELAVFRTGVVGGWTNDLAIGALFDHVCGPAGRARDDEERREHRRGNAHRVITDGRVPIEIGEHLLRFPHHAL